MYNGAVDLVGLGDQDGDAARAWQSLGDTALTLGKLGASITLNSPQFKPFGELLAPELTAFAPDVATAIGNDIKDRYVESYESGGVSAVLGEAAGDTAVLGVEILAGKGLGQIGKVSKLGKVAPDGSGLRSSAVVSTERAKEFLLKNDFSINNADDFLASFDGPLTARLVRPGEKFGRFSGIPEGQGSFLTKSAFDTSEQAVDALFLKPYGNPATFRQPVTATKRSIVLEGAIKNGSPPGATQSVIVNKNAFEFGTGVKLK